ncbi:MAG TPA: helix-turn-helix domain-containing protein [Polyangiales bacterium]|nr:helix-turn-helix domain-containing protein [Polyangiales bacterium]
MDPASSPLGPLPGYVVSGQARLPKRERTRLSLLEAAVAVFGEKGVEAATIQDIALAARVATGTFYNHFKAKDELLAALALWIGDGFCQRIAQSYAQIADGAERMAIGNRRYIQLALDTPQWALLLLQLVAAAPEAAARIAEYSIADLRLGLKQKRFRISNERAAQDLIGGTISAAMRSVALGELPAAVRRGYDSAVAALVLQGLGMTPQEASLVARKPLPEVT